MSFTAIASYEFPSRLGPPILYSMRYDVALQRPDQLKIVMPGDGPATEFSFDGKEIVAFAPAQNLVAVTAAPPTLEGALKLAYQAGCGVLPVHRPTAARPLGRHQPGRDAGLRHRSVGSGRRHAHADDRLGQRRALHAAVDRRRTTSYRGASVRSTATMRAACGTTWSCRTGSSTAPCRPRPSAPHKARAGQPMAFAVPGPKRPRARDEAGSGEARGQAAMKHEEPR